MATRSNVETTNVPAFTHLNDLAAERNGGRILFATDDFFAVAENLIKEEEAVWREGEYTELGKWMDGWETRRRRRPGHDFTVIKLAAAGTVSGVEINTAFFTGNHAPRVSIQAVLADADQEVVSMDRTSRMGCAATEDELDKAAGTEQWETILPTVNLQPGYADVCRNYFNISSNKTWSHIRLNMFPDGGIARLRVFGRVRVPAIKLGEITDLVSFSNGGECVSFSDAHFGHPRNLVRPGKGTSMADGWETARRLDRPAVLAVKGDGLINYSGQEWCVLKLGIKGKPVVVEIDTNHFKGNFPDAVRVEGGEAHHGKGNTNWVELLPFQKLGPHQTRTFPVDCSTPVSYLRVTILPDGGISRLRLFGLPCGEVELPENLDAV